MAFLHEISHGLRLLIDCFKTIEYFRFQFGPKTIVYYFFDYSFQKNLKSIAFPIVCEKGIILPIGLPSFDQKHDLFQKPRTTVKACQGVQQRMTNTFLRNRDST